MDIHIGQIIKEKLDYKKISITEFSKKINCSRRNAYKIFEKPNIDTELLLRINNAIGENLFINYFTKEEIITYSKHQVASHILNQALKELQAAIYVRYVEQEKEKLIKKKRKELKESNKLKKVK